jgi:hypothetical protein
MPHNRVYRPRGGCVAHRLGMRRGASDWPRAHQIHLVNSDDRFGDVVLRVGWEREQRETSRTRRGWRRRRGSFEGMIRRRAASSGKKVSKEPPSQTRDADPSEPAGGSNPTHDDKERHEWDAPVSSFSSMDQQASRPTETQKPTEPEMESSRALAAASALAASSAACCAVEGAACRFSGAWGVGWAELIGDVVAGGGLVVAAGGRVGAGMVWVLGRAGGTEPGLWGRSGLPKPRRAGSSLV